jgi:hypothetical protein
MRFNFLIIKKHMNIGIDISREAELITRAKEEKEKRENLKNKKEEADWDKSDVITAEKGWDKIAPSARELDNSLKEFEHDLDNLEKRMHESGLDAEFDGLKRKLRDRLSSFLSY